MFDFAAVFGGETSGVLASAGKSRAGFLDPSFRFGMSWRRTMTSGSTQSVVCTSSQLLKFFVASVSNFSGSSLRP
jgi:hypothetical protein